LIGKRGGEYSPAINALSENNGVNFLESYYYIMQGKKQAIDWVSEFTKSAACRSFLLDSGAFTYMSNAKKDLNVEKYLAGYIAYIKATNTDLFFELDIDCKIGYEKVMDIRSTLEKQTGKKCIPVWHKSRGIDDFKQMCHDYEYASIGGIASGEISRQKLKQILPFLIKHATKEGCRIHGLGVGSPNGTLLDYYSIDSSSWNAGIRYGTILHRFNGHAIDQIKPETDRKGSRSEIALYNLREWIKFANYMEYDYVHR